MAIKSKNSDFFDVSYFTQLIEDNKLRFYKTAKVILKNDDDAYDALQEALLSIYKSYKDLNIKEYFSTWATRIVINKCYDLLRKNKKKNYLDIDDETNANVVNPHYDKYDDDKYGIKKALESLNEEQKIVTILYYYDDYSIKEISQIINVPEGTVKSRLAKAREILKNKVVKEEI